MSTPTATDPYPPALERRANNQWRELYDGAMTPNYGTRRIAIVRGRGSRVWDADGREYLDFLSGISVNNLGHCHPRITEAIQRQAETLVHCTNLYYIPVQIEFARLLARHCFAERMFFGNSGAEANEAAIKIARRWAHENRGPEAHQIISMGNSFHGRTLGTLSATGHKKLWEGFQPMVEGFKFAEFNNLASVEALMTDRTCAVIVEPIQGEGGIRLAQPEFLKGLRELCTQTDALLIFDEIQCGLCRTGPLFAYQGYGVEPDIMTLAKSLGGGLAMGVMLTTEKIASAFAPGAHGSTCGGNPLVCAAAHAYLSELIEGDYARRCAESGAYLIEKLEAALSGCANLAEVRAKGLMIGIEVKAGGPGIVRACEAKGLLVNCTAGQTIRILPPLNVSRDEIDEAVDILVPIIQEAGA